MGLALNGYKAIVEMQFADFVTCGFNQIINNLAKTHYRWAQGVDVVIRMPAGAGTGAGPFHSQSNEAWFTKTPGLKWFTRLSRLMPKACCWPPLTIPTR
jgi:2-oxoisovalerate dehydrogenase E1 component